MKETVFWTCGSTLSYRDLCKHYAWFSLENAMFIAVEETKPLGKGNGKISWKGRNINIHTSYAVFL